MKAFVTGATGFLGIQVLQELAKRGVEIIALHRPTADLSELKKLAGISYVVGDICDPDSIMRGMPENVDVVFHIAGSVAHLPPSQENSRYGVNQGGTRNVIEVCLKKNIGRLIYTSTVLTYDFHADRLVTEHSKPNLWCKDAYIHSKMLADREVDKGVEAGLDVIYLHPSAMFGAYDKATWSKLFLEIYRGLPLPFVPPGGGSVCHARQVAKAHVSAYDKGKKGQHYILGGPDITWLQVGQKIAQILNKQPPIAALPEPIFKLFGHTEFTISTLLHRPPTFTPHATFILCKKVYSSSDKAINELGYEPSSLDTMLMDCYEWMVGAQMLPSPVMV